LFVLQVFSFHLGLELGRAVVMQSPAAVAVLRRIEARLRRSEDGQDLLEYGVLAALIAIFAIGAVSMLGNTVHQLFWQTIVNNF
jgi:Flp pilus assembly pilin Flp